MKQPSTIIGRSELIEFPVYAYRDVPARIDTGAKTSSIWASGIRIIDNKLCFTLFDDPSEHYNGHQVETKDFEQRVIASSNGQFETRFVVKLTVKLKDRRIKASFSLANRATQAYPVLVGRNILRGKFLVDVTRGHNSKAEKERSEQLQAQLHHMIELHKAEETS